MFPLHIITPVKDSIDLSLIAIQSIIGAGLPEGATYTVYNDNSTPENTAILQAKAAELGFSLVHLSDITDTPSPNYLTVLRVSRLKALEAGAHLCIVESDVTVKPDTIRRLWEKAGQLPRCGMAAAVTVDEGENINYPYLKLASKLRKGGDVPLRNHLSFCCTLLSNDLLKAVDFGKFDPTRSWFDVTVSREALRAGLQNYVCADLTVLHKPHGSRPWKLLKYTNPVKYYWQKITLRRDKI